MTIKKLKDILETLICRGKEDYTVVVQDGIDWRKLSTETIGVDDDEKELAL